MINKVFKDIDFLREEFPTFINNLKELNVLNESQSLLLTVRYRNTVDWILLLNLLSDEWKCRKKGVSHIITIQKWIIYYHTSLRLSNYQLMEYSKVGYTVDLLNSIRHKEEVQRLST